jgi:flagellar basal body-associated protein FliL
MEPDLISQFGGAAVIIAVALVALIITMMWIVFPLFVFSRLGRIMQATETAARELQTIRSMTAGIQEHTGNTARSIGANPFRPQG